MTSVATFIPPITIAPFLSRTSAYMRRSLTTHGSHQHTILFPSNITCCKFHVTATGKPPIEKPAASTALFRTTRDDPPMLQVLLVKRGKAPNKGLWALPGGSVEPHESLLAAAARELQEETEINANAVHYIPSPVHVIDVPLPTAQIVYRIHVFAAHFHAPSFFHEPVAADDAAEACFYTMDAIRTLPTVSTLQAALKDAQEAIATAVATIQEPK